jgi:hypothetical protein
MLFITAASPFLRGPLDLARFARALLADPLDKPVPVGRRQLERLADRHPEAGASVLAPAELKERLAPCVDRYVGEDAVCSRRLVVLPFPGMKNVWSKGSCTS